MLVFGFDGTYLAHNSEIALAIQEFSLGGVILFEKNFTSTAQVRKLNQQLNYYTPKTPLLIGMDYEGGNIDRLKKLPGTLETLSARRCASLSHKQYESLLRDMAKTMSKLGFNLNFAPVVDLNILDKAGLIGGAGEVIPMILT